jgi:hypothetical protein
VLRLKQVDQAKAAIVAAAQDTTKMVAAALGVSVLALLLAVVAVIFSVRGRKA